MTSIAREDRLRSIQNPPKSFPGSTPQDTFILGIAQLPPVDLPMCHMTSEVESRSDLENYILISCDHHIHRREQY